mgnify:CR=1 FL=1
MFSREIGRVVSVDSFKVIIELDDNIKGTQKSGYYDIYEVAKVNAYVILPIGSDKIVALITRVKSFEDNEIEKLTGEIKFSKSKRHLLATMLGTISEGKYLDGVYNYPILDNPVWYIIKEDLDKIFDDVSSKDEVDYQKDFYLPIGKNSNFPDYDIKINPDKFFAKHSAILGNTGSGKSCTVTSILQALFNFNYSKNKEDKKELKSATIIIFDTNGEYKKAFEGFENINAFTISEEGMRVPYWFMNYEDFEYLFEPSAGTQAPILKKALGMSKSKINLKSWKDKKIHISYINQLEELKNLLEKNQKDLLQFLIHRLDNLKNDFNKNYSSFSQINIVLKNLSNEKNKNNLKDEFGIKGSISSEIVKESYDILDKELKKIVTEKAIVTNSNIDLPKYFNFNDLINNGLDEAIDDIEENKNKYREYISSLKLRLASFMSDLRKSEPLLFNQNNIENSLEIFFKYIFGDKELINGNLFADYKNKNDTSKRKNQIIILDLSLIPFELLETITGLIGRLVLEFSQRINKVEEYKEDRGAYPISLILEEAQNYIPEIDKNNKKSITKKVFERIAREGRKFGVSLLVSSQRPSELSKTILSQCNTFIVHKLQNPEDQKYIRQIVSSANEDLLNQLPILPQQHAIIMGEAVRTPSQIKINDITSKPDSNNPRFIEKWLKGKDKIEIDKIVKKWLEEKEKITLNE